MISIQLNGGLGNQLFQYAAAKSLSMYHGVPLQIDVSSFHRENLPELEVPRDFELYNFTGIQDKTFILSEAENEAIMNFLKKRSVSKLLPNHRRKIYSEPFYHFDPYFFKSKKNVLLRGQWQSEKYFYHYKDFIREALQLKPELVQNSIAKAEQLRSVNSVGVHIRRTDYLRKRIILEWHGVMGRDYYEKAFNILDKKIDDYKVFYFTDDPEWVEQNLLPLKMGKLISGRDSTSHHEDFFLISQCRHNIIANSSFSWWGAWLNNNPEKLVIAPRNWFDKGPKDTYDLIPKGWITV